MKKKKTIWFLLGGCFLSILSIIVSSSYELKFSFNKANANNSFELILDSHNRFNSEQCTNGSSVINTTSGNPVLFQGSALSFLRMDL